jgi:hypothetical protein
VQPGETVEVRVGPGHKGPHVTEVLSVDSSTATAPEKPRANYRSATANRPFRRVCRGNRYREVVQQPDGLRIHYSG